MSGTPKVVNHQQAPILQMFEKAARATIEEKGNSNVADIRPIHMEDQMRQEGIGVPFNQPLLVSFGCDCKIISPLRNDVSYAAPRIGHISGIPRDHVKMKMWDCLSSGRS
jgi:hypothetical protein